jgi:short-subunit dehydrogenase
VFTRDGSVQHARVVLVVGASSGIGEACALALAERGTHLLLVGRNERRLDAVAESCREAGALDASTFGIDVLDDGELRAVVAHAQHSYGRLDVVVHTAAVMAYGTVEAVPSDVFRRVVDTSIHGTANVARSVLPVMRAQKFGTFIVVTSLLASIPVPEMGAYITGKWGQLALARILQLETRDAAGVNVCVVAPGAVDTPIYRRAANFIGRMGNPPPPVDSAGKVARAVLRRVDRPRHRTSVGRANRFVILGFRTLPRLFDALVTPLFERFGLSNEPVPYDVGNVFDPYYDPQRLIREEVTS